MVRVSLLDPAAQNKIYDNFGRIFLFQYSALRLDVQGATEFPCSIDGNHGQQADYALLIGCVETRRKNVLQGGTPGAAELAVETESAFLSGEAWCRATSDDERPRSPGC